MVKVSLSCMRKYPFQETTSTTVSRRILLFGGAASALVVMGACSGGSGSGPASSPTSPTISSAGGASPAPMTTVPTGLDPGMGSGLGDGVFPRTVVHYQGSTTINAAPTKVVVISTGQVDALLLHGICPIASTTASGSENPVADYLRQAYPEQSSAIDAITVVGTRNEPDIEAIAAVGPDLILTNITGKDDAETLYQNLSEVAPTVTMRGTGQFWKTDFLLLSDALGKREAAQTHLEEFTATAKEAGVKLSSAGKVSLLRKTKDKIRIFGPLSFAGSVLADMSLARPDSQQFTDGVSHELSSENLDEADGDWLLYGVQGGNEADLTSEALWGSLGAVTANHAVEVDDDPFFLNAGPTAARVVLDQVSSHLSA
ncbi:hypothetical protein HMPREF1531_00563 [Propionibacterium sp. oral taxon 192 str. F0372]|nr:hypothetical protein HMPREF1531_00563 [Propionibacterium sp. oral taxon 192 str. F0372]